MKELPTGWAEVELADVVSADAPIMYGILQPGPETTDGVPYVRPTEIVGDIIRIDEVRRTTNEIASKYARSTLQPHDLILSIVGTIGKVAEVPELLAGANITQSSVRVRPDAVSIYGAYLAHQLRSPFMRLQYDEKSLGTGVPRLNVADVRELKTLVPPIGEQRRIVAKLDDLLARSRRAKEELAAIPALLERYRQSVLAASLSDFRPLTDCSDLNFQTTTLGGICSLITSGSRGWGKHYAEAESASRFIRVGDMSRNSLAVDVGNAARVNAPGDAEADRSRLCPNDILISITADVGMVGVVPPAIGDAYINQHVALCRIREQSRIDPRFVGYVLSDPLGLRLKIMDAGYGATKASLSLDQLRSLPLVLPSIKVQREIVRRIDAAFARIDAVRQVVDAQLAATTALDRTILTRAFRGELVPQDPADEPASVLLDRIRAERAAAPAKKPARKPRKAAP